MDAYTHPEALWALPFWGLLRWFQQDRFFSPSLFILYCSIADYGASLVTLEEKLWKPSQHIKKQRHYFADKGLVVKAMVFSSSHVWMWELDHKDGWAPRNWCFWTVVLEKILESSLDRKEIKAVNPKGNQSWIFIGRTDAETETPILWPPAVKNWLIGKDPDAGKEWRQEEKGMTEDEMVGWHHRLDGHEFEQAPGLGDGQGSLACCSPWGRRVGHDWVTELNWWLKQ